ncbi:N-acetylmuramoyl-L-alanine amidase [Flavobacterium sp.]|uniref:N-acetylmuramoyl-L-alanine amidase family protein n=1 Tax=Flavobacterium sp. TaxID=239 RepID=UPI002619DDC2|nr:N-acetylmuramoyl-L-alanine amidase [Flavobacterium sp.]
MRNVFKILAVTVVAFSIYAFTTNEKPETIKIVIDAGHGGDDTGAKYGALSEKTIVSQISSKINELNKNTNVEIYFTRTDDSFLTLEKRAKIINDINPDFFLSLHVNSNKNNATLGIESYVAKESAHSEKSLTIANELLLKLSKATNLNSRETKKAPFYILRETNCPGLILELGYLSNENDRNYLTNENNQEIIAKTILEFVSEIK